MLADVLALKQHKINSQCNDMTYYTKFVGFVFVTDDYNGMLSKVRPIPSFEEAAMKILLICGDYYHPAQVVTDGLSPLQAQGFAFDIITEACDVDPQGFKDYPVVMLCKSEELSLGVYTPWKTLALQQALADYVESGGGLLAVHSGTVAGRDTALLDRLIGCKFDYHPADCPVLVQPVKPHPVTCGVLPFCETDEHYRLQILADDVDILAASYSPPQGDPEKYEAEPYFNSPPWICPAAYVRSQGRGRVCVLTPGHLLPVWLNPNFQLMLKNAIRWCAGQGA
jgi:type 1 glutamine amidotransferase